MQQNILAVNRCPEQFKNQWRLALAEINEAMKSTNQEIKKGAKVILALAPNMIFRAPNSRERELSTRAKWSTRFNKFWAGDFQSLVLDIPTSSFRALETAGIRITREHLRTEEVQDEKMTSRSSKASKERPTIKGHQVSRIPTACPSKSRNA